MEKNKNKKILVINGPNLGILGLRQPQVYGSQTLAQLIDQLDQKAKQHGYQLCAFQSNSEGDLVTFLNDSLIVLQDQPLAGIVINPGAYTHTSIALRDALEPFTDFKIPIVEVHISNVFVREPFRRHSYVSSLATAVLCGMGVAGYHVALDHVHMIELEKKEKK